MLQKLKIVQSLKEDCKVIMGIGDVRSMTMINFASLLGILPLDYYVYVPMHLSGGPGKFLKNEMSWDLVVSSIPGETISEKLCEWTNRELKEMQELFTSELFPNMYENGSCIISRGIIRDDPYFMLPWYDCNSKKVTEPKFQLCFRVIGHKRNTFELEVFDGCSRHIIISSLSPERSQVKYNFKDSGEMTETSHTLNKCFFNSLFKN